VIPKAVYPVPQGRSVAIGFSAVMLLAVAWVRAEDHLNQTRGAEVTARNFYGNLQVFENTEGAYRTMIHGQIIHGRQHTAEGKLDQPTTYYTPESGAGKALQIKAAQGPLRVGVIGLGVGTLVSYGRQQDYFRLYDIDPLVVDIARKNFSYLARTPATTEIILGDARLQLEREPAQKFDVLLVDAFSGDSVPIHLLTYEAFAQYFRHLKPDGVLAVHITNRFLDLRPVVKTAANRFAKEVRMVDADGIDGTLVLRSNWALLSNDAALFKSPQLAGAIAIEDRPGFQPWKDDYSSIFSILK
jgi:spermidine synthase